MTQTTLDVSQSLGGSATAASVRPEEAMGDGQGWVNVHERAARRSQSSMKPHDAVDGAQRATAPAIAKEACGGAGTMSPAAKR
jgi:hypothetical protein